MNGSIGALLLFVLVLCLALGSGRLQAKTAQEMTDDELEDSLMCADGFYDIGELLEELERRHAAGAV